jgi:sterol 14alpha-demethylase
MSLYDAFSSLAIALPILPTIAIVVFVAVAQNVLRQLYFPDTSRPPMVFHIFPLVGSTIRYGMDPYKFFFECRAKYGDCFTFILLGKPTTVYLGQKGNDFILNGKHADLNAEQIYGKLTTPVFGKGVVYDCPNERLMDQKRVSRSPMRCASSRAATLVLIREQLVNERGLYFRCSPLVHSYICSGS